MTTDVTVYELLLEAKYIMPLNLGTWPKMLFLKICLHELLITHCNTTVNLNNPISWKSKGNNPVPSTSLRSGWRSCHGYCQTTNKRAGHAGG